MATVTWTGGAGDGDWNTGGNWSGASAPSGGDDVFFNAGSSSVTTGPSSAINLASLTVTNGYSGNWTAVVTLGTITALSFAGIGSTYRVNMAVTSGSVFVPPQTTISWEGGNWTTVSFSGLGRVLRNSGTSVLTTGSILPGITMECLSSNATFTTLRNAGGTVIAAGNIGTYTGAGNDRLTTIGAAAITTAATCSNGSYFNHQSSGTIASLTNFPGSMFPCSGSTKNFTITAWTIWAGSMVVERPPGITITSTTTYVGNLATPSVPPRP